MNQFILNVIKKRVESLGMDHPATIKAMEALGLLYLNAGKFDLAEPLIVSSFEKHRLVY